MDNTLLTWRMTRFWRILCLKPWILMFHWKHRSWSVTNAQYYLHKLPEWLKVCWNWFWTCHGGTWMEKGHFWHLDLNFHIPAKMTLPYGHKYVTRPTCGDQMVKNRIEMNLNAIWAHLNGKMTLFTPKPWILTWTNEGHCREVILFHWNMLEQLEVSLESPKGF